MAVDAQPTPISTHPAKATGNTGAETLEFEIVSGEDWDKAVVDFDGLAQEQLYVFARKRWPDVKCEPVVFFKEGEVVGGALIMVQPLPLKLGAIAVAKWAPFLRDNGHADAREHYTDIVETLIAEYGDKRGMMLSILPKATPTPENMAFEVLKSRGFTAGSNLLFPNRYIVNLRLDDEEQKKSFSQKWRYHLNKSLRTDLTFERAEADQIEVFFRLYEAMSARKKFADHSAFETIKDLMAVAESKLRPEMFFVRERGEIVAGAIIFKAGDTAVYLYGATNDRSLSLRAGYFLHWHIIRWLRDNTPARWYDLGGTDGFQGLHQFKKGMLGRKGHIEPVPPVMNYASHRGIAIVASLAYWVRDRAQNLRRLVEKLRSDVATPDQER